MGKIFLVVVELKSIGQDRLGGFESMKFQCEYGDKFSGAASKSHNRPKQEKFFVNLDLEALVSDTWIHVLVFVVIIGVNYATAIKNASL